MISGSSKGDGAASALRENIYFALHNRKLVVGLSITLFMLVFALVGPLFAQHPALEYGGHLSVAPTTKDGYWLGTTLLGERLRRNGSAHVRPPSIPMRVRGSIST